MLLALPGVIGVEGEKFFRDTEGGVMLFAYILGMIGYSVAALVLTGSSIGGFDKWTGRTGPATTLRDHIRLATMPVAPSPRPEPVVAATIVEEPSAS
jgi:hypothetical protein